MDVTTQNVQEVTLTGPLWFQSLLKADFPKACQQHEQREKGNVQKLFCLDCRRSICQLCVADHLNHTAIRACRNLRDNSVVEEDTAKVVDTTGIAQYNINGRKVVFLNNRARPLARNGCGACTTCGSELKTNNLFCSLRCKVLAISKNSKESAQELFFYPPSANSPVADPLLRTPAPPTPPRLQPPSPTNVAMAETGAGGSSSSSAGNPISKSASSKRHTPDNYDVHFPVASAPKKKRTTHGTSPSYINGSSPSSARSPPKEKMVPVLQLVIPTPMAISPRRRRKGTPMRSPLS